MTTPQTVPVVQIFDYLYAGPTAVPNETISVQLTYGQATYSSPVVALTTSPYTATTDANGYWTVSVPANDLINPSGTTYSVRTPSGTYDISVPSVAVPAGGWQSSAIVVNTPPSIGVTGPNLPSGTTVLGAFNVNGISTFNDDVIITAATGTGLTVTGSAANANPTVDINPKPSNAGGFQGLTIEAATDPGALTTDLHILGIKAATATFHAASFTGASNFYRHEILAPTYSFDSTFAYTTGLTGTLLVQGPAVGANFGANSQGQSLFGQHYAIQASGGLTALGSSNNADWYNNALVSDGGFTVLNSIGNQNGNPMGIHPDYASGLDVIPSSGGIGTVLSGVNLTSVTNWGINGLFTELRYLNIVGPTVLSNGGSGTITDAATVKIGGGPVAGSGVTITNPWALWMLGKLRVDAAAQITSPSNQALYVEAVAGQGKIWQVDASVASAANGVKVTGNAAGAGADLVVIAPAGTANDSLRINAKGSGAVTLQGTATGAVNIGSHLVSTLSGTPTTTALGANVTSATFTGNDVRGKIVVVMAGALAANTRIATCTWAATFGAVTPLPLLVSETSGAGLAIVNFYSGAESATAFDLFCEQALAAGTYTVRYINIA